MDAKAVKATSIWPGPNLCLAIEGYENRSGRIDQIAKRYRDLCAEAAPLLSLREWQILWETLGSDYDDDLRLMWGKVSNGTDNLENEEAFVLATGLKVKGMTDAERCSILEVLGRVGYVNRDRLSSAPSRLILSGCGARIKRSPVGG